MPQTLTTYQEYAAFYGETPPITEPQFPVYLSMVTQAIQDYTLSNLFYQTYTNTVLNAPPSTRLVLPQGPVWDDDTFSLSVNYYAAGNVSQFTSSNVLTKYVNYVLMVDEDNPSISTSRVVQFFSVGATSGGPWSGAPWSPNWQRDTMMLTPKQVPSYGSVLVTYNAGYQTIPASLALAANMLVTLVWQRRLVGVPVQSESRGAWSQSYMQGVLYLIMGNPTVAGLLEKHRNYNKFLGWAVC